MCLIEVVLPLVSATKVKGLRIAWLFYPRVNSDQRQERSSPEKDENKLGPKQGNHNVHRLIVGCPSATERPPDHQHIHHSCDIGFVDI
jgi:hypothetical protein